MTTVDSQPAAAAAPWPQMLRSREGVLEIPGALGLHHGRSITGVRVAWRMAGPPDAPVLAVLGGISAHRRVYSPEPSAPGWWGEIVGPGRALPAEKFRILAFDYLGGSGDTTGPRGGSGFPAISSFDQAELLLRLLDHLGIEALRAIVGASYGGMVALAFAERHASRVGQLVVISAADRTHPMSTAWRCVQRRAVRFAIECGRPAEGLKLARALAMATYRSPEEFGARFGGEPRPAPAGTIAGGSFVFPVEEYLMARGEEYAARYQPDGFLCLSESIDLHRVDATRVGTPTAAVGIREDQLVPIGDMRALAARLPQGQLHEFSSLYGHDAFLKEAQVLAPIFARLTGSSR